MSLNKIFYLLVYIMNIKLDHCVIYKIRCRDETITDLYIKHTFNYPKRVTDHKSRCSNPNSQYNTKLYQTILSTGGLNNWKFEIVETFSDCKSIDDAKNREKYWIIQLNANLNTNSPITTSEERKEQMKQWKNNNQDNYKQYQKKYQQRDKYKQYQKEYQKQYREKQKLKK